VFITPSKPVIEWPRGGRRWCNSMVGRGCGR
jgi:hypothetical protein